MSKVRWYRIVGWLALLLSLQCKAGDAGQKGPQAVATIKPTIVRQVSHDPAAFTQGLLYCNGYLYESTGLYSHSSLRRLDPATGRVVLRRPVPDLFAEGLARVQDVLVQLTWKAGTALVYSLDTFKPVGTFRYAGEGWGLTTDSLNYIMSNGSDTLYFRNQSFEVVRTVAVRYRGAPLTQLNELEYVDGSVFANVWHSDFIFRINPATGIVTQVIDASELAANSGTTNPEDVLNGIAYNDSTHTFYITGKRWPTMFEVTLPLSR